MAGLDIDPMGGILTRQSGYQLPNHAVAPVDYGLSQLWSIDVVGENREVIDGHVALRRRVKQQRADVPLLLVAEARPDGTAATPGIASLWVNFRELQAEFLSPTLTGAGTSNDSFVPYTGGPTLTGRIQCDGLTIATQGVDSWMLLLHLVLPDGPMS